MNELTYVFQKTPIRTMLIDAEPWFVLADVCTVLGIRNSRDVYANMLDDDEKGVGKTDTPGGKQEVQIVNEPGLYTVVIRSNSEKAKPFRRWVTHEVLPAIRKQGFFSALTPEDTLKAVAQGLDYDHFIEDAVIPIMEAQTEFSLQDLLDHWAGFPIKTLDDWKRAKPLIAEKCKDRQQRLSTFCHSELDYQDDEKMFKAIRRYQWSSREAAGHSQKIKGIRWFDDEALTLLKASIGRVALS